MKVKLFDGRNDVVLRTGDDPTVVGRLIFVWESSGCGGGGGVGDVVMWDSSLDIRDGGKDI